MRRLRLSCDNTCRCRLGGGSWMVADHDTAGMCVTSEVSSVRACVSVNL